MRGRVAAVRRIETFPHPRLYSPHHLFCSPSTLSHEFPYMYALLQTSGEKLVNFLVQPKKGTKWPKNLPKFKTRQEAIAVCKSLCKLQFMHRSEKRGKGDLVVSCSSSNNVVCLFSSLSSFSIFVLLPVAGGVFKSRC